MDSFPAEKESPLLSYTEPTEPKGAGEPFFREAAPPAVSAALRPPCAPIAAHRKPRERGNSDETDVSFWPLSPALSEISQTSLSQPRFKGLFSASPLPVAPASVQHAHWASQWAFASWQHFQRQERQRIPQKLPPSPLPSELLRAAAYARHRRGQGGVILMELDAGENDPMKESTLEWPTTLLAASLRVPQELRPPKAPRRKKSRPAPPRMKSYKTAFASWQQVRQMYQQQAETESRASLAIRQSALVQQEAMSDFTAALACLIRG
eukprot:g2038.t1